MICYLFISFNADRQFCDGYLTSHHILFVQVFLDVVESVNILVNSNGQIVRSDVVGALKMRTYLR